MEELWRETRISAEPESEVVLTYRQPDGVEPVTLRYERELPERMRPRPEERAPYRVCLPDEGGPEVYLLRRRRNPGHGGACACMWACLCW